MNILTDTSPSFLIRNTLKPLSGHVTTYNSDFVRPIYFFLMSRNGRRVMMKAFRGESLVRGKTCHGIVNKRPHPKSSNYIFVTRRLNSKDYHIIRRCRGIICENGGATDHPAVICRILGKPVIIIEKATKYFQEGEEVTLDASLETVHAGRQDLAAVTVNQNDKCLYSLVSKNKVKFHLSIIDERDIARINKLKHAADVVEQFFLREELIWVKENMDPFLYLRDNGLGKTSDFLKGHLLKCLRRLNSGQTLNFRSLDLRSDQRMHFRDAPANKESNPELGLHGIRRLLKEPDLLVAELKAVDAMYHRGHDNLLFSLPFINDNEEFREVQRLISETCTHRIKIGVFIETPAAVNNLAYFLRDGASFIYIGTKDLTQMILACDRSNNAVRHLFDSKKPSVQAAIRRVINRCRSAGVPVVLFTTLEDIPFYIKRFPDSKIFSMCRSEYEDLLLLT